MRTRVTLIQALVFLLALSLLLASHRTAYASTTVTADLAHCTVTVTVNIEIHGPAATQELADRWKRNIERTWNGPTGELAKNVADLNGLDVNANRAEVDRLAREFLRQEGVPENCSSVNCCNICFVANVRLRQGNTPAPGNHQINVVPTYEEKVINGKTERVRNRSFVMVPLDEARRHESTTGQWRDDDTRDATDEPWPPEAHETGHLMGLDDQYTNAAGINPGHEHDLMANNLSFPFEDAIGNILRIGGAECNCCDDASPLYRRYVVAFRPASDAILTCNLDILREALHDYEDQRRELEHVRISPADRYYLPRRLDDMIARLRKAIEDCPEEPHEPVPSTTGIPGTGPGVVVDGGEWCTYWGWTPKEVPTPTTPEEVPTPTTPTEVPTPTTPEEVPTPTTPTEVPTPIIKATVTDPNTGQPVTGCRLALTSPPPDLPGTRARDDSGYNEDSTQGTTGADGTCRLMAGGSPPEFQDGGEMPTAEVEIDLPSFKSYIVKIKIDKGKEAWDNPSSYLDPAVSYFVARKWIVGDSMYVVINVPTIKGEQK